MSELDTLRMTPAKLVACLLKWRAKLSIEEMPIAQLKCMYYNANRPKGEKGEELSEYPPLNPDKFQVFRRDTLAAKDAEYGPGGKHNLVGAKADRGAWEAFVKGTAKRQGG